MNGVGSAGAASAARDTAEKARSDIAVAVALADQGAFERLLGTERRQPAQRDEERPRKQDQERTGRAATSQPERKGAAVPDRTLRAAAARARNTTAGPRSSEPSQDTTASRRPAFRPGAAVATGQPQIPGATVEKMTPAGIEASRAQAVTAFRDDASLRPAAAATPVGTAAETKTAFEIVKTGTAADTIEPAEQIRQPNKADGTPASQLPGGAPKTPRPGRTRSEAPAQAQETAQATQDIRPAVADAAVQAFGEALATGGGAKAATVSPQPDASTVAADPELTRQVRSQVLGQLTGKLGSLGGKGSLRLMLSPPELGRLEIRFTREGNNLHLTFRVESAAAARALQDGAGQLQETLLGAKSTWQQVEISVEQEEDETEEREGRGRQSRDDDGDRPSPEHDEHGGERWT